MTQSALDRSIARVTGESVGLIRQRGFVLLTPSAPHRQRRNHRPIAEKSVVNQPHPKDNSIPSS